ncbi:hypothetical protein K443DRAFT_677502 [Laccaria amethystina LaAM-08-1]|uniref:Uncharacterized protein n=1 Tax=Laccaria amethystina LaAM-08-1 TaxID=1095629 RepID=A0A0C9XLW6_9AGAR|nr:hypothetical protein K443DRAFT_677502 [Laccaria amethystina LaAM-08-1]
MARALGLRPNHVSPKTFTKDTPDKFNYLIYAPFDKPIIALPRKVSLGKHIFNILLTDLNPTPLKQDFALLGMRFQLNYRVLFRLYALVLLVIRQISVFVSMLRQ